MSKTKEIRTDNITDIRNDLLEVYKGLRKGDVSTSEAKEAVNAAGKVFASCKVQMEYAKMRGEVPIIPFIK